MTKSIDRRRFIQNGAAAGVALGAYASASQAAESKAANDKIVVAVMGVNGRGRSLARGFAQQDNCEVAFVCDVDQRAILKGQAAVEGYQKVKPQGLGDFRKALDDKTVDVLAIAAPNHWHAPATILGCKAGKHVYVEKPCSHTAEEGELAVAAARKYKRVVTQGTQRRSRQPIVDAIARLHKGDIGRLMYSRTWYNSRRGSIGTGKKVSVPKWLDFKLWQGPAPDRAYKDNLVHYNWHWHWHWGNGELGNNGVHALDVARWGMDVDYPIHVTSSGGRFRFDDDQETPDTHVVSYVFEGNKQIIWEGLSWSPYGPGGTSFGITFHGDKGTMHVFDSGYTIYDMHNKKIDSDSGRGGDAEHFADFLGCIRNGGKPNADIEEAHKSTLLCHLGNIAQRTGRALSTDPKNGHIKGDADAAALWGRDEYRKGFEPTV